MGIFVNMNQSVSGGLQETGNKQGGEVVGVGTHLGRWLNYRRLGENIPFKITKNQTYFWLGFILVVPVVATLMG